MAVQWTIEKRLNGLSSQKRRHPLALHAMADMYKEGLDRDVRWPDSKAMNLMKESANLGDAQLHSLNWPWYSQNMMGKNMR